MSFTPAGQRLTTALQERQSMDKQKQERLLECVSQNVNKSITSRLDKTVRSEIDSKVVPGKKSGQPFFFLFFFL